MKLKKCKGIGRAINYGCGNLTENRKYGLGVNCCYVDWLLHSENGKATIFKNTIRAKTNIVKADRATTKQKKIDNKSIRALIAEAKEPFQKLIRIRDHRKTCICCDELLPFNIGEYDAGHFKKAEIYSGLIFHPDNVHGQRVYCNQHLHGNEGQYSTGLIKRIGWSRYNRLLALAIKYKQYTWDRTKLIEMKAHYLKELREVEKGKDINDVDFSIGIVN